MDKKDVIPVILSSMRDIIAEQDREGEIPEESINESMYLLGRESFVDSLTLVSLLVEVEQRLNNDFGLEITIADEKAMSRENSPFRTIETLASYIEEITLDKEPHD